MQLVQETSLVGVLNRSPYTDFRQVLDGTPMYLAGFPHFPRNFSRDTFIAGIISGDADLLFAQLIASADQQGSVYDQTTGETPGRIHHEFPGVNQVYPGREEFSTYSACDTTPLFLIAAEGLQHADEEQFETFIAHRTHNVKRAIDYILEHVGEDNLFYEGLHADKYGLKVTYWKDSILPHTDGKDEPHYPIVFSLAHFMAARGLLAAGRLSNNPKLLTKAHNMFIAGIDRFIQSDNFIVYQDTAGSLEQASSDELHALAYIPIEYAASLPLPAIHERARLLQTPFGFMCTPTEIARSLKDPYHGDKVWVFEQAMIAYGAGKFEQAWLAQVAGSVGMHINQGQELFGLKYAADGSIINQPIPQGNPRQLWSIAAAEFFSGRSNLHRHPWL